jgi:hypothetical protein
VVTKDRNKHYCGSETGGSKAVFREEAMNIIRKGQTRGLAKGGIVGQARFIERTLGLAA